MPPTTIRTNVAATAASVSARSPRSTLPVAGLILRLSGLAAMRHPHVAHGALAVDGRDGFEVVLRRRRGRRPLQCVAFPWIISGPDSSLVAQVEIDHKHEHRRGDQER